MHKDLERVVEIPEGVELIISGDEITAKADGKEVKKKLNIKNISLKKEEGKVKLISKNATKRESAMIGTIAAHLKNMMDGLKEDYTYKMEICNVHFPMNVKVEGDKIIIKSFLGETVDRFSKILPEVNVEISGKEITITSHNKELAGQTAANLEKATKLKGRDRRIFQDGIFITEKPGRII